MNYRKIIHIRKQTRARLLRLSLLLASSLLPCIVSVASYSRSSDKNIAAPNLTSTVAIPNATTNTLITKKSITS